MGQAPRSGLWGLSVLPAPGHLWSSCPPSPQHLLTSRGHSRGVPRSWGARGGSLGPSLCNYTSPPCWLGALGGCASSQSSSGKWSLRPPPPPPWVDSGEHFNLLAHPLLSPAPSPPLEQAHRSSLVAGNSPSLSTACNQISTLWVLHILVP